MIHCVLHDPHDSVAVVVVENLKAGTRLTGLILDEDRTIELTCRQDIPIGHKVALKDLSVGDTVIKYGVDIGKVVQPIRQGELEVDPGRHEVRLRGKPVPLTATEFRLLHHLVQNPGRVYSRAQLLDKAVGTDVIVIERNIDVHMSALRRKLEDYGDRLLTIRGVGYKFTE